LFMPLTGLMALVLLFGAYAIVDGAVNLVMAVRQGRSGSPWGWLVFAGATSIAAGVATLVWPAITGLILAFVIAAWAVVLGVSEIAAAIRLRKEIEGEWMLGAAGVLSVLFGVLLFVSPGTGALAMIMVIGAYAVISGARMIGASMRLRRWGRGEHHRHEPMHHGGAPRPA